MAPRIVKSLTNMEIDEISLVDRGANQHATVAIAKRAPEEETMPDLFNEEGQPLDEDALEHGDVVYDEDGQAYEFTLEEDNEVEDEPQPVGKRFEFGKSATPTLADSVLEELSKAYSDEDRDEVIRKAFEGLQEQANQNAQYAEIAKQERDLRLTREYISKADEYNLPIAGEELGPVLYRMAETMSYDDCAVIHKALESSGGMIFDEIGYIGGGDNNDVMAQVNATAEEFGKSAGENGGEHAEHVVGVFDQNPAAYDEYVASRRGF